MTTILRRIAIGVLAAALLGGCAGAKPRPSEALRQPEQSLQLGMRAWQDGDLSAARLYFANAHAQYRSIDHSRGQLQALLNLATIAVALGEAAQAQRTLGDASRLLIDDDPLRHRLHLLRAQVHLLSANVDAARTDLAAVLGEAQDEATLTAASIERARVALLAGQPAQPWLDRAVARVAATAPAAVRASLQRVLADAARRRGDAAGQLRHLQTALALYRESAHRPGIAATHVGLAEHALEGGADALARDHYFRALHVQLWIHDRVHAERTLGALAAIEQAAGNDDRARDLQELRMQLQAPQPPPDWNDATRRAAALNGG